MDAYENDFRFVATETCIDPNQSSEDIAIKVMELLDTKKQFQENLMIKTYSYFEYVGEDDEIKNFIENWTKHIMFDYGVDEDDFLAESKGPTMNFQKCDDSSDRYLVECWNSVYDEDTKIIFVNRENMLEIIESMVMFRATLYDGYGDYVLDE